MSDNSPMPAPGRLSADDTAPRDPREVAGIYLADSLANIAAVQRVMARAGLSDLRLENLLDTARIALESAQPITEELTSDA